MSLLRRALSFAAASTAVALFAEGVAAIALGGAITAIGEWLGARSA